MSFSPNLINGEEHRQAVMALEVFKEDDVIDEPCLARVPDELVICMAGDSETLWASIQLVEDLRVLSEGIDSTMVLWEPERVLTCLRTRPTLLGALVKAIRDEKLKPGQD